MNGSQSRGPLTNSELDDTVDEFWFAVYAVILCEIIKVYKALHWIHLKQSGKTRRDESNSLYSPRKVVDSANCRCFCYHLQAGIHDAWWLRQWDSCGYILDSLLLIPISDSLYAIALASGDCCNQCLAKRDQSPAILSPIFFLYFVFSTKIHKRWLISWIHCALSEFLNKLLKQ